MAAPRLLRLSRSRAPHVGVSTVTANCRSALFDGMRYKLAGPFAIMLDVELEPPWLVNGAGDFPDFAQGCAA